MMSERDHASVRSISASARSTRSDAVGALSSPTKIAIGVAFAGYFPAVSLSGPLGYSGNPFAAYGATNPVWSFGASLAQPLVNGGAVPITGGNPTVANTSLIQVFGQAGNDTMLFNGANVNGATLTNAAGARLVNSDGATLTNRDARTVLTNQAGASAASTAFWTLLAVAVIGTLNPSAGDVSSAMNDPKLLSLERQTPATFVQRRAYTICPAGSFDAGAVIFDCARMIRRQRQDRKSVV